MRNSVVRLAPEGAGQVLPGPGLEFWGSENWTMGVPRASFISKNKPARRQPRAGLDVMTRRRQRWASAHWVWLDPPLGAYRRDRSTTPPRSIWRQIWNLAVGSGFSIGY